MSGIPGGASLIDGMFVYDMWDKPISAGQTETWAYVGENRKADAGFCVEGSQGLAGANAPAPIVQLQHIMLVLGVIAYSK